MVSLRGPGPETHAPENGNAEGREVLRRHHFEDQRWVLRCLLGGLPLCPELAENSPRADEWGGEHGGDRADARDRLEARQETVEERELLSRVAEPPVGQPQLRDRRREGSNARSTRSSFMKLRVTRPAADSTSSASAIWPTTSASVPRRNRRPAPLWRAPQRRTSWRSTRDVVSAGASANSSVTIR